LSESTTDKIHDFVIIGAGFSGLCAGIKLKSIGEEDFVILERGDSVGGTWRDNSYPGCACDVMSVLYSFSFEQNPDWTRTFPTQEEIWEYLKKTAEKYGLLPHIRFRQFVSLSTYDEGARLWRVHTADGILSARILISAAGGLSEPAFPKIPGLDSFQGKTFHSAQWDHAYDLAGKRVAVIGTGASAIQVVPSVAPLVEQLDLYQRTPAWVAPRNDKAVPNWVKALRRTPLVWLSRWFVYLRGEASVLLFTRFPAVMRLLQRLLVRHIQNQVNDPELAARLTPDYTVGCKRILISDDWYPAFNRTNVRLITEGIREIQENGVVTTDGKLRAADAIILCTGFQATDNPATDRIRGRGGVSLAENWKESGEEAYLGTLVHGFPNFFLLVGPNTGIGHTSLVFMIEAQVHFMIRTLKEWRRGTLSEIEIRKNVQDRFNERLHERMKRTVWASGCKSWYQNKNGKVTTLWPGFTFVFWWQLRRWRRDLFC